MYLTPTLGAATDPALYKTNDFASWAKFSTGTDASLPEITPDYATAPDGTHTATRVVLNRGATLGNSGKYSILRAAGIATPNGVNTDSLYLRLTPGAAAASVDLRVSVPGVVETNKVVSLTNAWQRFATQTPSLTTGRQDFDLILWDNPQLPSATTPAADFLVWGFRVDAGTTVQGIDYAAGNGTINPKWLLLGGAALLLLSGNRR